MDITQVLGTLLAGGRLAAKLTIRQAADRSGLTPERISVIERGHGELAFAELLPLLRTYGVPLSLFGAAFEVAQAAAAATSSKGP